MGALCHFIPYQYLIVRRIEQKLDDHLYQKVIEVFFTACMVSSFGMMIIARQQMLVWDDSLLKMNTFVKYGIHTILRYA